MRCIVFVIMFFLWPPIFSQNYPSHAYELIFRFDTARVYPGVKKIKHTTFIEGEKIKYRSAILLLNQKGQSLRPDGPTYWPHHPLFMLLHQFSDDWKNSMVDYQIDSLRRYTMQTFHDPMMTDDSTRYQFEYSSSSQRPKSMKEYRYMSFLDSTILLEFIELQYLPNEIIVKYPRVEKSVKLHYKFNQHGNLLKLYGDDICSGCHLVFSEEKFELSDIPIEFDYEYDEKGRVTAMYETTGGKRELLFTRKYYPR